MVYRDQGRLCPSCRAPFFADARLGTAEGYLCSQCGAALVSFARLQERAPRLVEALAGATMARPINPLRCVACDVPMRALAWNDVVVDVCDVHGIWFERDELESLLRPLVRVT